MRRGFTLIELLVSISIISLLASVVLASLNSARDKGRLAAGEQQNTNIFHSIGDSAVLQLDFDDCTGSTTVDQSGAGNNSTLINSVSWVTSTYSGKGCAVSLDGLAGYVSTNSTQSLQYTGGAMTLSAWIYPNTGETDGGHIFSKPWDSAGNYNYRLTYNNTGTLSLLLSGTSGWSMTTSQAIPKNTWTFVAATIDSNNVAKIYANGALLATGTHTVPSWIAGNGYAVCVGTLFPYGNGWGGNTGFSFNGRIDEARIYTQTLTSDDVRNLYLAEASSHGIQVADLK